MPFQIPIKLYFYVKSKHLKHVQLYIYFLPCIGIPSFKKGLAGHSLNGSDQATSSLQEAHQAFRMPVSAQSSLPRLTSLVGSTRSTLRLDFHHFHSISWCSTVSKTDLYLWQTTTLVCSNILCLLILHVNPHRCLLPNQDPKGWRDSLVRTRSTEQPGLTSGHKGMTTTTWRAYLLCARHNTKDFACIIWFISHLCTNVTSLL